MHPRERIKLRFGPYHTPRFKYGDVVHCERFGEVVLCGLSSGRIPWPVCRLGSNRAIALIGDLVRAVRQESSIAIQHWWGVGYNTVWEWRRALGVEDTAGSSKLRSLYAKEPAMDAARAKSMAKARDPERRAKISAGLRGKPRPAHVMRALHKGNRGRKHSAASRKKMSAAQKALWRQGAGGRRPWTAEEDSLVRTLSVAEVAGQTGRSLIAVYSRRHDLGVEDGRKKVPSGRV